MFWILSIFGRYGSISFLGVEVYVDENGQLAVNEAECWPYDVIFMDMKMPVMDGLEALCLLRKNGYKVPIVAMTANTMKEDREECLESGCVDFFGKPVDRAQIKEVVSRYLQPVCPVDSKVIALVSNDLDDDLEYLELVEQFVKKLPSTVDDIK